MAKLNRHDVARKLEEHGYSDKMNARVHCDILFIWVDGEPGLACGAVADATEAQAAIDDFFRKHRRDYISPKEQEEKAFGELLKKHGVKLFD